MKEEQLTIFRRRNIGFVFQNYNLVPVLNVYENIVLPVELDGDQPDRTYMEEIVQMLALEDKLQNMPNNLSGGQQQRVAIARAIAASPPMILADEPTGNLDSRSGSEVMDLLHGLHRDGHTVVLITHDAKIASEAERQICIHDGEIVMEKTAG